MTRPDILYLQKLWLEAQSRAPHGISIPFPTKKEAAAFRLRLHRAVRDVRLNPGSDWALYRALNANMVVIKADPEGGWSLNIAPVTSDPLLQRIAESTGVSLDSGAEFEAEASLKRLKSLYPDEDPH